MSRLLSSVLQTIGRNNLSVKMLVSSKHIGPCSRSSGKSIHVAYNQPKSLLQTSRDSVVLPGQKQTQFFRFPGNSNIFYSGMERLMIEQVFFILHKPMPSSFYNRVFDDITYSEQGQASILDKRDSGFEYLMGSLLKKRRRKMNRQKYKKRRKRDRFKRTALKNLREKKYQRKERAFERKQSMLSKMVVNKTISKRRARYLSHKLLPGVVKRQSFN